MIAGEKIFSTSAAAFAVDRAGQIVVWNQAAEQTFGYLESKALGKQCWKLLSGRDIFGNPSCCEGCPIRTTAYSDKPINQFQVDFKTATHVPKRFMVDTLMIFNHPGKETFVHLCHPESGVDKSPVDKSIVERSTKNNIRKTLTPRETEVLILLDKGMTVPEIATELGISTHTVRNHTQHILLKLHVHSRFESVALGRKLGLI